MGNQAESRTLSGWTGPFRVGDEVSLTTSNIVNRGVIELISDEGLWLVDSKYLGMDGYNGGSWVPKGAVSEIAAYGWSVKPPERR